MVEFCELSDRAVFMRGIVSSWLVIVICAAASGKLPKDGTGIHPKRMTDAPSGF